MHNSWSKFLVVLLVATLQCFAPLIHAHTNGVPSNHDIHSHHKVAHTPANVQALDAEHHHGQTIGVAKEYKRDYSLPIFDSSVSAPAISLSPRVSLTADSWRSFAAPGIRFTRPSPQAP